MRPPYVFISYRRDDSLAAARALVRFLRAHYGRHSVFMDMAEIRDGSDWRKAIDNALEKATILLPIIGKNWLSLTDKHAKRRIDQADDWVRKEIEFALAENRTIIPIYIGIEPFPEDAFPDTLTQIARLQSPVITDHDSESEWKKLAHRLQSYGFGHLKADVRYPQPAVLLQPFSDDQIREVLGSLRGWRCVSSPVPGMEHVTRTELHKSYEFPTFQHAIDFISHAAEDINKKQHHPRWENIWRTVNVWLATWDMQFQVSQLDVDLALHLDREAKKFGALV